jgi:peptidoglycan/LPS O-acetylase OafA/YrhL
MVGVRRLLPVDYTRPAGWVLFFALLIAASVPTYYLFERPTQNILRQWLLQKRECNIRERSGRMPVMRSLP